MARARIARFSGAAAAAFTTIVISAVCLAPTASGTPGKKAALQGEMSRVSADAETQPVILARMPAKTEAGGTYTVRAGDYLSVIAGREYGNPGCWPGIYRANRDEISNPSVIYIGERLRIPAACDSTPVITYTATASYTSRTQSQPQQSSGPATGGSGYGVTSAFQACVIRTESGGNAQIWNASGHYGLYQFSAGTWAAAGGDPALFGSASAAYQTQIFWNAVRLWGTSPWAPYDGC